VTRHIAARPPVSRLEVGYWICTLYISLESLWAGITDILHAPPLFEELHRLGYPSHFGALLGIWKVLGAIALAIPRRPLLKEWAYAGMFFDFSAAIVAHAAAHDAPFWYLGPVLSLAALAASWHLRPASRRLAGATI
jgi:hypothetical protein